MSTRPQATARGTVTAYAVQRKIQVPKWAKYAAIGAAVVGGGVLLYELARHGGHIHNIGNIVLGSVIGAVVGSVVSNLINKVMKKL